MKNFSFLLLSLLISQVIYPQENLNQSLTDTTKPIQYRRGIELQEGYQSYEEKYVGKNLNEEKRSKFPLQSTGIWTELNPKVPRVDYLGIHFVNKDTGWVCGDLGALIKTTNGGISWTVSETNSTALLLKVHSYDGRIVIVTGYNGTILRSTNGGVEFSQIASSVTADLWGVQMLNDTVGFVCGLNQTLLKTTNAGLSWQPVVIGLNQHYWALDFLNEQFGMIACGGGSILKTTDGGINWTEQQAGDASALFTIDTIDSLNIAAAGANGKNVYSSDGGTSWTQNNRLHHDELNSIRFINTETGYTIGTYSGESWGIRKTTNKGVSWYTPPIQNLSEWELELLPEGVGYSVGDALKIYKTEGEYENWVNLFFNINLADVYFTDEMTGYIAGGTWTGGPVYKTTDGGLSWFGLPNFPVGLFTSTLISITFTDSVTGFASGTNTTVKTTDAGESWYEPSGLPGGIGRFFFLNKNNGWGTSGKNILKTTDGGENWLTQLTVPNGSFSSINFVDSLYGWATISGRRPYKTTDGGLNWIEQTDLDIWESRDVYIKDYLNGFLLESNKLYKTTDGGTTFNLVLNITGFSIAAKFSNYGDSTIFITGYKTYRSIDGGINWFDFDELSGIRINGLSLLGMGFGFAVGELGIVLRYYDETVPVELMNFKALIEDNKVLLNWATASETNNRGFFIERIKEDENYWKTLTFINGAGTSTNTNFYSYQDRLNKFDKYKYRLKQIDYNGQYGYSSEIEIEYINNLSFYLSQNYPNPFNPVTNINFNLPEKTFVRIILYDATGREVKKIIEQEMEAGYYTVRLSFEGISSGVYFYKMKTGSGFTSTKKLTIIK